MEFLSGLSQEFLVRAPGHLPNTIVSELFWSSFCGGGGGGSNFPATHATITTQSQKHDTHLVTTLEQSNPKNTLAIILRNYFGIHVWGVISVSFQKVLDRRKASGIAKMRQKCV